jgi:hypothetical protein
MWHKLKLLGQSGGVNFDKASSFKQSIAHLLHSKTEDGSCYKGQLTAGYVHNESTAFCKLQTVIPMW